METQSLHIKSNDINDPAIQEAVRLLKAGEVVAFPTETVYGLGANALDAVAVAQIFRAKGRPSDNPLIVHVESIEQAKTLVNDWPPAADILSQTMWPGPLAIILKKSNLVPGIVTGGGDTVALRCPAHPTALALIRACGFPLAAPSANRSNYISPTTAAHVMKSLAGRIPLIIDGGPSNGGIESTVIDLTGDLPEILRPGIVTATEVCNILKITVPLADRINNVREEENSKSPGRKLVHYAPDTPLMVTDYGNIPETLNDLSRFMPLNSIAVMQFGRNPALKSVNQIAEVRQMPEDAGEYARILYATLHELDALRLSCIVCELPPEEIRWSGVIDRLSRAARKTSSQEWLKKDS